MSSDYVFQCKLDDTGRVEYGYWVLKELLVHVDDMIIFSKFPDSENCQDYIYEDGKIIYSPIAKQENEFVDANDT